MSHKYYYVNVSSEQSASTIMRNEKILHSIIRWQCLQLNSFLWQVQIYALKVCVPQQPALSFYSRLTSYCAALPQCTKSQAQTVPLSERSPLFTLHYLFKVGKVWSVVPDHVDQH